MTRPYTVLLVFSLLGLLLLSVISASAGSNTLPVTRMGVMTQPITANALKPAECAALNLTTVLVGKGTFTGSSSPTLILGSSGVDTITGGSSTDCILGGGGNDTINGGGGNDLLFGGPGNDKLNGSSGTNTCYGGSPRYGGAAPTPNPSDTYQNCQYTYP